MNTAHYPAVISTVLGSDEEVWVRENKTMNVRPSVQICHFDSDMLLLNTFHTRLNRKSPVLQLYCTIFFLSVF